MSKNIIIQEGGIGKQLAADKLKTNLVGGGSCLWVPEDETRLGTKHITENGTYRASDEGLYGYSEVTVSGIGSVTGRDPDTGEEVEVHPDPETGEIVTTVLPTEIRVITPPAKTDYADGETIDYSGIVVHAYSSTGQDMGAVPFNELVFPETIADAQKTDEWTDGQGLNAMQITYVPTWWHGVTPNETEREGQVYVHTSAIGAYEGRPASCGGDGPATLLLTRYTGVNYAACMTGIASFNLYSHYDGPGGEVYGYKYLYGWFRVGGSSGGAGDSVFKPVAWEQNLTNVPVSTVDPTTVDPTTLHATQSLPVQWPRTPDGAVLETTFTINVTGGST